MDVDDLISFILNRGIVLVYGPAGSGKTNLTLWLLSRVSRSTEAKQLFYVSTEGSSYVHLLSRYCFGNNIYFINAVNIDHLLDIILNVCYGKKDVAAIAVDSINNFYRTEALESNIVNKLLNTIMALLAYAHRRMGSYIIVTAQVREVDTLSFSGESILRFWSDVIAYIRKVGEPELGGRELIFESPDEIAGLTLELRIGDKGVELRKPSTQYI
ncbi:MAG: hypothetical protein DRO14_02895 [Thermoprotei archaeon]|nr:MAG: hypothetical protein DRO14_02895 [Thermoprotei archaeon]